MNSSASALAMSSLLNLAGFRLRGRRAGCIHCQGRSHWTVSVTDEVAFCHRCRWTANVFILAGELGLLDGNPELREKLLLEATEHRRQRAEAEKFKQFVNDRLERIGQQYRALAHAARHAEDCLRAGEQDPYVSELAWDALERFRAFEARIEREGLCDLEILRDEWSKLRAA